MGTRGHTHGESMLSTPAINANGKETNSIPMIKT